MCSNRNLVKRVFPAQKLIFPTCGSYCLTINKINARRGQEERATGQQRPMLERTTLQLFRDCLRTAHHIGGDSAKGRALKQVVKDGFRKHIGVTDAAEISKLKEDAIRALSNYLVMKSLNKSKK